MSRSGRDDERLSESYRKVIGDLETKNAHYKHGLKESEAETFKWRQSSIQKDEMLAQRDEALKSQDRQMRVKDIQVATLLGRFGFDSAESAEALCTELGQGKGKVVDIREVLSELEETKQEKERHETLRMDAHRAMAETIEDVRKERRKGEELKALNERLREEADAAREEKERWMGEVRRLEEVQKHLQNKIHELELKARTSALVTNTDKENRVLQTTLTPTNSAPSTPTKPRTPNRRNVSISPHKSPSKLGPEQKRLLASHQDLLTRYKLLEAKYDHTGDRYDTLHAANQALTERYRMELAKWRKLQVWLYDYGNEGEALKTSAMSDKEKKKHRQERLDFKRRRFHELKEKSKVEREKEMSHFDRLLDLDAQFDMEEPHAPSPRLHETIAPLAGPSLEGSPGAIAFVNPEPIFTEPLSSPTTTPRRVSLKHARETGHSLLLESPQSKRLRSDHQASSDTEDDSQALPALFSQVPTAGLRPILPEPTVLVPTASEALACSPVDQPPATNIPITTSHTPPVSSGTLATEPSSTPVVTVKAEPSSSHVPAPTPATVRKRKNVTTAAQLHTPVSITRPSGGRQLRPRTRTTVKQEPVDDEPQVDHGLGSGHTHDFVQGSSATPLPAAVTKAKATRKSPRKTQELTKMTKLVPAPTPTPAVKGAMLPPSMTPGDYSGFKGRGRYGGTATRGAAPGAGHEGTSEPSVPVTTALAPIRVTPVETSINAQFEIDPTRNAGANFAFDEVVRGHERMKLPGGDCPDCREYYEGIGTLPDRLQRPMWRSPTASPVVVGGRVGHLCAKHSLDLLPAPDFSQDHGHAQDHDLKALSERYRQEQVARHKGDVSRHRARWDRAATPPGYWEIGFPDTQEQDQINERAEEMDRRKREVIAREAESGNGRYRRRS